MTAATTVAAGAAVDAPATALYGRVSERAAFLDVSISPEELADLAVRLDMGEDELSALEAVFTYLADNRAVYADKAMEDAGFLSQLDFRTPVREGDLYAIVFGDMVFTGLDPETGGSRDISPEERERVRERFGGAESIDSGASELLSVALAGRLRR